jgi:hypothetical protein
MSLHNRHADRGGDQDGDNRNLAQRLWWPVRGVGNRRFLEAGCKNAHEHTQVCSKSNIPRHAQLRKKKSKNHMTTYLK